MRIGMRGEASQNSLADFTNIAISDKNKSEKEEHNQMVSGDSAIISTQGAMLLAGENADHKDTKQNMEAVHEMLEQAEQSANTIAEETKVKTRCMTIACRLMGGDEVPSQDIKYLMKNDPGLYSQAMKMRIPKQKPKKYGTVLEDSSKKYSNASGDEAKKEEVKGTDSPITFEGNDQQVPTKATTVTVVIQSSAK